MKPLMLRSTLRVEVGGECAKRLNGKDTSRPNVFTAKQRLEGFSDGLISGPGQESQEASLALEQAADDLGDGRSNGDRRPEGGSLSLIKRDLGRLATALRER